MLNIKGRNGIYILGLLERVMRVGIIFWVIRVLFIFFINSWLVSIGGIYRWCMERVNIVLREEERIIKRKRENIKVKLKLEVK